MHLKPDFEQALERLIRIRGFNSKSEAIRTAVKEALENAVAIKGHVHFSDWIGTAGIRSENPNPRFSHNDQLWGE